MALSKSLKEKNKLKNSNDPLYLSAEENAYAQKTIQFGIWRYLVEDQRIGLSDEIYRIYEEKIGNTFEDFESKIHPEDEEKVSHHIKNMLEGQAYDIEFRIISKEGQVKFIREKVAICTDDDGKLKKIVGIVQDITDQKLLADELISINQDLYGDEKIKGIGHFKYHLLEDHYYISEELYHIYDIEPDEFRNDYRNLKEIILPEDQGILKKIIATVSNGKQSKEEYRIFTKDAKIKHLQITAHAVFSAEGEVIVIYGNVKDITEEKELRKKLGDKENEIQRVEESFQNIVRESKDGFLVLDKNGSITFSSKSVERIINCQAENILGRQVTTLFQKEEVLTIEKMIHSVLKNPAQSVEAELSFICTTGKEKCLEIFMRNRLEDSSIRGILFILRDITQKKDLEKQMIYDANHDPLTDLINRSCFFEEFALLKKKAVETNNRYAFMLITINQLKDIDLSFGHEIGNQLILKITKQLKASVPKDSIISRYSEDDFALIVKENSKEKSFPEFVEKIINELSRNFKIDSYELSVTVNIGASVFPKASDDQFSLRDSVKLALLRSKKLGVNRYNFYSSELNIHYYKNFTLRNDLQQAIKNDELEVYYQPLVNLNDHRIIGAEALIRWNHPEWGLVSPGEFIPIAEETGLIIEIGKWLVEKVFKDHKRWLDKGYPAIDIGINFSTIQFFEEDFVKKLKNQIIKMKFDPTFLIVEITENILLRNKEKINKDLEELKASGIRIALDDFGTGYSSLSYLNSLNIDIIKIDRSFIKGIPADFVSSAITKATVQLAKELDLEIVVEGIEKFEQLNYLKAIDCIRGQGYLYSKAVGLEEFERILQKKYKLPLKSNSYSPDSDNDRRQFFRIDFEKLLKTEMTIQEMAGKTIDVGNTKVLIENIGPGGLGFISDIRFPTEDSLIFRFMTHLAEEDLVVYGHPVWSKEIDTLNEGIEKSLYQYRIEFIIDEPDRETLTELLNKVEAKMKEDDFYKKKEFTPLSYIKYFE